MNITKTIFFNCGLWQLTICDTCQTSNFHTEDDCTYTVVSTHNQDYEDIRAEPNVYFIFQMNSGENFGLKMDPGLTF